jgi:hypothetical protein
MKDSSRRSFVKTSAATGLTFTFAGLIRAHGQSGGGNTTWNPEGTFFSTNSGETTTYDPNGTYVTTDPGVTTTWDPDATTTSETTTIDTTATTETTEESGPYTGIKGPNTSGNVLSNTDKSSIGSVIINIYEKNGGDKGPLKETQTWNFKWKFAQSLVVENSSQPEYFKTDCCKAIAQDSLLTLEFINYSKDGGPPTSENIGGDIKKVLDQILKITNLDNPIKGPKVKVARQADDGSNDEELDVVIGIQNGDSSNADNGIEINVTSKLSPDKGKSSSRTITWKSAPSFEGFNLDHYNELIQNAVLQHVTITNQEISEAVSTLPEPKGTPHERNSTYTAHRLTEAPPAGEGCKVADYTVQEEEEEEEEEEED